jgi:hypothetical protein
MKNTMKGPPLTYAETKDPRPSNKNKRTPNPKLTGKPIVCKVCKMPGGTLEKIDNEKNEYKHPKC